MLFRSEGRLTRLSLSPPPLYDRTPPLLPCTSSTPLLASRISRCCPDASILLRLDVPPRVVIVLCCNTIVSVANAACYCLVVGDNDPVLKGTPDDGDVNGSYSLIITSDHAASCLELDRSGSESRRRTHWHARAPFFVAPSMVRAWNAVNTKND